MVNLVNCGNQLPEPNLILYANTNDEVTTYLSHQKHSCVHMYPKAKQDRDEESEVVYKITCKNCIQVQMY